MPASGVSGIGCDAGPAGERERRRDVVERALRHGLQERKDRRRERRRDARHLDPHHAVAGARHGLVGDAADDAEARAEVELVELPRGARLAVAAQVLELLRLQVEDGHLVVLFGGREVQRVAHAARSRVTRSDSRQSSWTKYSWKCARFRISSCCRSIENCCTCPSRKLASGVPVFGSARADR